MISCSEACTNELSYEEITNMADCELDPISKDPVKDSDLSDIWKAKAHDELQEKKEWRDRDIQALREMVQGIPNLKCPTDDEFLLRFLRVQKFDYERSAAMLQRYYLMRKTWPDNFEKALPSLAKELYTDKQQTILPHRDVSGRRIFLYRAGVWDPYAMSTTDISAANYLMLEMMAKEAKTQIAGITVVVDMANFGFRHIYNVTTDFVKSIANMIQNSFPLRFREIHIINESSFFHIVFALIKPFLSETIKERIKMHGSNLDTLHAVIPPNILPEEFGGTCGPMENSDIVDVMLQQEEYFKELNSYGFNEELSEGAIQDLTEPHPFQGYCLANSGQEN